MKENKLIVCLTHDIDRVRKTYQYISRDLRSFNLKGLSTIISWNKPYWQFDQMAEIESKYGAKSTIFFLHETAKTNWLKPKNWQITLGRYSVNEPEVKKIIRNFDNNGWEIGVHGSYYSWNNIDLLKNEKKNLEDILGHEVTGVRQHYLNMEEPLTWVLQKKAGFVYDSSLGRLDRSGYKDHRIAPFIDEASGMYIIPITLMECYLFNEVNHNKQLALNKALYWMDYAQKKNVPYNILWHQRMFNEEEFPGYKWVYEHILKEAVIRQAEFVTCNSIVQSMKKSQ